jgi:hypothetical protein
LDKHTHKESRVDHEVNDGRVPQIFNQMLKEKKESRGITIFTADMVLTMRKQGYFKK